MRQKKEVVVKSLVFKGNNNELFYYKNLLSNRGLQLFRNEMDTLYYNLISVFFVGYNSGRISATK